MILVLNMKMNMSLSSMIAYEEYIRQKDVIILPQYPYLALFNGGKYHLGSQDVSKFLKGSYTGEVCAKSLKQLGVEYVLVGHHERREYFNEGLEDFKAKIRNVIDNDMIPIYCVDQVDITNNTTLKNSIIEQLKIIPDDTKEIFIAYEPSWLIGKEEGKIDIELMENIFSIIDEYLSSRSIEHKLLYGGGVNEANIQSLLDMKRNSGFIISSSALDLEKFTHIYERLK